MSRTKPGPLVTTVVPLALGGFCLITGAWKALIERGQGEYEIETSPLDKWAYLWVGIAVAVLCTGVCLAFRQRRKSS